MMGIRKTIILLASLFTILHKCRGHDVMEIYTQEIVFGNLVIELSVHEGVKLRTGAATEAEKNGEVQFHIYLTARDTENRIVWKTPIMTDRGAIKYYRSPEEAVDDAKYKIGLAGAGE
jgi:hypothetical protein